MKKITLLFAAIVAGVTMQAQEFSAVSDSGSTTGGTYSPQAVIWDQPSIGGSGIVSGFSIQEDVGIYSADDFELTESTVITKITAYGFNSDGTLLQNLSGLALYIYENNGSNVPNGDPSQVGTGIVELPSIETLPIPGYPIVIVEDGAGGYAFEIDMYLANGDTDVVLPAGQYWLVIAPRQNVADITVGANRWNWFDAGVPANGVNEAHLIDPSDVFGAGATSWTAFSALGLTFGSVAFVIEGDALGIDDNLAELSSVYPNPTKDILNVKLPSNAEVESSSLYDILGKDTGVRLINGQMDTSDLARGVYILNVNTTMGVLTQKVVKQ